MDDSSLLSHMLQRLAKDEMRLTEEHLKQFLKRGQGAQQAVDTVLKRPAVEPKFRSKWEANFANKLELEKRAGFITAYWYEPFSLWLPGKVRYKPDFLVQRHDPRFVVSIDCAMPTILEVIEVKGWSKNRRDGITRLKIAAALFPCFIWRMVWMKKGGGFDGEYL